MHNYSAVFPGYLGNLRRWLYPPKSPPKAADHNL